MLGDNFSLRFQAALHEDNPTSLSMLEYMEMTSHKTNNVPAGNGEKRRLISSTLFKRAVVFTRICGSFLMQGCNKYSVNKDKFSNNCPVAESNQSNWIIWLMCFNQTIIFAGFGTNIKDTV